MSTDNSNFDRLKEISDSHASISELAEKFQKDYHELSEKFEQQSQQLEQTNEQLTEALVTNSKLSVYLNNILECLNAGVVVFGVDGNINLFNKAAERLTGILKNDALNKNYKDVFPNDEHAPTYNLLEIKEIKVHGEKWFATQPVGYSSSKIYNEDNEFCGIVEILYDISAEKKLRETIRHVSALAALGEMAATVAHQVRNPLAGIIGFTDLLQRDLPDDHSSALISKKISTGAKELNRIITNLLDFTKKVEPKYRELDMVSFIKKTTESIFTEPYAVNNVIDFQTNIESVLLRFDPILMRQAFVNIIQNACQIMEPDGGTVSVTLEIVDGNIIRIEFIDTGKGFSQEDSDKLFKPFFTTRNNGIGLGLSMVRKVVDFHNGAVTSKISKSGGAVFTIDLPL